MLAVSLRSKFHHVSANSWTFVGTGAISSGTLSGGTAGIADVTATRLKNAINSNGTISPFFNAIAIGADVTIRRNITGEITGWELSTTDIDTTNFNLLNPTFPGGYNNKPGVLIDLDNEQTGVGSAVLSVRNSGTEYLALRNATNVLQEPLQVLADFSDYFGNLGFQLSVDNFYVKQLINTRPLGGGPRQFQIYNTNDYAQSTNYIYTQLTMADGFMQLDCARPDLNNATQVLLWEEGIDISVTTPMGAKAWHFLPNGDLDLPPGGTIDGYDLANFIQVLPDLPDHTHNPGYALDGGLLHPTNTEKLISAEKHTADGLASDTLTEHAFSANSFYQQNAAWIKFIPDAALTSNDTDYATINVYSRLETGGTQTLLSSISTKTVGMVEAIGQMHTRMTSHGLDGAEHFHGGGATPDIVNFPFGLGEGTTDSSIRSDVYQLALTYKAHHDSARLAGGGPYHNAQATAHYLATNPPIFPADMHVARTMLNDIVAKYNLHDADTIAHTTGSTHQVTPVNGSGSWVAFRPVWLANVGYIYPAEFGCLTWEITKSGSGVIVPSGVLTASLARSNSE